MKLILALSILVCSTKYGIALRCWNHHNRTGLCASTNSQTKCAALEGPIEGKRIAINGCIPKDLEHFCNTQIPSNASEVRKIGGPMHAEFSPILPPGMFTVCCCSTDGCNTEEFTKACGTVDDTKPTVDTEKSTGSDAGFVSTNYHLLFSSILFFFVALI